MSIDRRTVPSCGNGVFVDAIPAEGQQTKASERGTGFFNWARSMTEISNCWLSAIQMSQNRNQWD